MTTLRTVSTSVFLALVVASPAAATDDWRKSICKEFLDSLEASVEDMDDLDEFYEARSSYLSYQDSYLRLKIEACREVFYYDDDDESEHDDDDGHEWEEAWSSWN